MSGPDGQEACRPAAYPGLLAALMAAVRPEFRGDVLVFDPRDPVFGGPPCAVSGCDRPHRHRGLCLSHWQRWRVRKPDFEEFAAAADPGWHPRSVPHPARFPDANTQARRWASASGTTNATCAPTGRMSAPGSRRAARDPAGPWSPAGSPPADCGPGPCRVLPRPRVRLDDERPPGPRRVRRLLRRRGETRPRAHRPAGLAPGLRLEWQYAFQSRSDAGRQKVNPGEAQRAVSFTAGAGVTSLLDRHEDWWRQHKPPPGQPGYRDHAPVADPRRAPAGRGPRLRPRLGRGVPPRHLAAAQPRHQRPDRARPLRRHPPALAEDPGQALVPLAAGHRAQPRPARPRRPGPDPLRRLARLPGRERRHRGAHPAAARTLPRRPACRVRRQEAAKRAHREPQRLPHRGPPARLGARPARRRDDLPRGLPQARGTASPGPRRPRHGPGRAPRQPRPVSRSRPTG